MTEHEANAGRSAMIRRVEQTMEALWFLSRIRETNLTASDWMILKNIEGMARLLADSPYAPDASTSSSDTRAITGGNGNVLLAPGKLASIPLPAIPSPTRPTISVVR